MAKKLTDTVQLKNGQTLSNRLVQAPMQTYSGHSGGFASDATFEYYQARSKSAGMIITEYHYVSENGGPSSTPGPEYQQMGIYSDDHLDDARKIAQGLKKDGNKAILQIHHGGREANFRAEMGEDVVAPSAIDFPFLPYEVRELTESEIEQIILDFAAATSRAIKAGFDGVEIHGANHYLLQQFFSEYSNHRTDQWGGSLENRKRFPVEVARAVFETVKNEAPANFIVGYRISPEEIHGDTVGYDVKDSVQLVQTLTDNFPFDYIHLSLPKYNAAPYNAQVPFARFFDKVLDADTQLIVVGGILSEVLAQDALNYADLVAVARGTQMDPEFGEKIVQNRGNEIVRRISPKSVKDAKLTPGLIQTFSSKNSPFSFPGQESLYPLHKD